MTEEQAQSPEQPVEEAPAAPPHDEPMPAQAVAIDSHVDLEAEMRAQDERLKAAHLHAESCKVCLPAAPCLEAFRHAGYDPARYEEFFGHPPPAPEAEAAPPPAGAARYRAVHNVFIDGREITRGDVVEVRHDHGCPSLVPYEDGEG